MEDKLKLATAKMLQKMKDNKAKVLESAGIKNTQYKSMAVSSNDLRANAGESVQGLKAFNAPEAYGPVQPYDEYAYEERVAIMEYCGGMTRIQAEEEAAKQFIGIADKAGKIVFNENAKPKDLIMQIEHDFNIEFKQSLS